MKKLIFFSTILLASLFACQQGSDISPIVNPNAGTEIETRGNNPKERPFSGTLVFDEDGDFEDCLTCPYVPYAPPFGDSRKFLGHGNLTHLGNSTAESMPCYTYIFNEDFVVIGIYALLHLHF